ncbi:unannotated protein [freshwater metagenome]|uniref:Unannotated protein n=1 Tax=freshwater metagenome TaxID=449393 RepID=A0A6J7EYY2_9ZZZZ
MPNQPIAAPSAATPVDRLSLNAQWARPAANAVAPMVNACFCSNMWCFADAE